MVPLTGFPSGTALYSNHECILSQVSTQSHYPDTEPTSLCPILIMPSAWLGTGKYQFKSHWFDSTGVKTHGVGIRNCKVQIPRSSSMGGGCSTLLVTMPGRGSMGAYPLCWADVAPWSSVPVAAGRAWPYWWPLPWQPCTWPSYGAVTACSSWSTGSWSGPAG